MAAENNCLAQSNKSADGAKATKNVPGADKYDLRFTVTKRAKSPKSGDYKMMKLTIVCVAVAAFVHRRSPKGPTVRSSKRKQRLRPDRP